MPTIADTCAKLTRLSELVDIPRWCALLRSGDIAQTTGALWRVPRNPDSTRKGKCCLGVLAIDVLNLTTSATAEQEPWWVHAPAGRSDRVTGLLPAQWIHPDLDGYHWELPFVNIDGDPWSLPSLNDAGVTFPQIADLIEFFARPSQPTTDNPLWSQPA